MAGGDGGTADKFLSGIFWSIVGARASGGGSTTNIWDAVHQAAESWVAGVLGTTQTSPPTEAEIALRASSLLSNVTIQDVNYWNQQAGNYLRAQQALMGQEQDAQITGAGVFSSPWATTESNPAVPTRYQIRVLRDLTFHGFTSVNRQEWATYELTGPLTSVQDALDQADALFSQAKYNNRMTINETLQYSIVTV